MLSPFMAIGPRAGTLADFIRAVAAEHPNSDAILLAGDRITYAELMAGAASWARTFVALGVGLGDHVGILLPNSTELRQGAGIPSVTAVTISRRHAA
jgi:fatty-acyl-CoA synthase